MFNSKHISINYVRGGGSSFIDIGLEAFTASPSGKGSHASASNFHNTEAAASFTVMECPA